MKTKDRGGFDLTARIDKVMEILEDLNKRITKIEDEVHNLRIEIDELKKEEIEIPVEKAVPKATSIKLGYEPEWSKTDMPPRLKYVLEVIKKMEIKRKEVTAKTLSANLGIDDDTARVYLNELYRRGKVFKKRSKRDGRVVIYYTVAS